ncbi:hypothetical protein FE257_002059 [Aspergillus nanangensis]|uniref:Carrier domain-containing protein n=1 Tax=Aspergillus nanangensis TaxID=2582783 RepID=A0AAD4CTN8_ASPNN|nr:hypothetical protein FE257_002059 [Aspergillus nanangensis]
MPDPSVIVGMACRVPGTNNPSKLWDNIVEKKDTWRRMPKERFNVDAFYHPESSNKGTMNAKGGYYLDQSLGDFDNEFFGISGKEAAAMDPQQRILLEVVYEALEDAGIPLDSARGTNTSVYCGTFTNANDYNSLQGQDLEFYPTYAITGTGNPIISNRISYFYDFHGPSMTIDTACSSSLVGLHLGSQSLQNGESDISVIVGSALQFAPNVYQTLADMGFLSSDSRCRSFDVDGSGYVRGDGVCAVILKRQNDATHGGDRIRAVVKATATNHDGKTEGITLPSSQAQEALIRSIYKSSGLDPDHTQFFEAHGTGTKVGDPGETRAIGAVFATKSRKHDLFVGSVKSNIGHLEGASGLAGLIKTVLGMENATIPPNMLFNHPNPDIHFEAWKLQVPTSGIPWDTAHGVARRASVNSFGYGGSNAHVILEAYNPVSKIEASADMSGTPTRPHLIPISSHTSDAGKLALDALKGYIKSHPQLDPESLAFSLGTRRSMHSSRSFLIGHDQPSLLKDLETPRASAQWTTAAKDAQRIGFVFTGQGAQVFDMGRQLIDQSPLFKGILEKCDSILQSLPDRPSWSILEELLRGKESSLALVSLLREWEIVPKAVCGHSSGEIAAAYSAGILSLEAAIVVGYYRGLHMSEGANTPGAMMAVGLGRDEAAAEVKGYPGWMNIAAINSPTSVTLSGDKDAILELQESLEARGTFARLLKVEQAFHSHHMLPLAPAYEKSLNECPLFETQNNAACRMVSSVTARKVRPEQMNARYWAQNMCRPVRFSDALTGIVLGDREEKNVDILLEIGPHPALKGPSREILTALDVKLPYFGTLDRGAPAYESLLEAAGQLFAAGYPVDFEAVSQNHGIAKDTIIHESNATRLRDLPSYSWNHKNHWFTTRLVDEYLHRPFRHTLLGAPVPGSVKTLPRFRNYIRLSEIPWLADHVIDSRVVFPAAGFVCMAIEAGARLETERVRIKKIKLRDVIVTAALTLRDDSDDGCEVLVELHPVTNSSRTVSDNWYEFVISSYNEALEYTHHCRGRITVEYGTPQGLKPVHKYPDPEELYAKADRIVKPISIYSTLSELNSRYGPRFALLKDDVATGPGFAVTRMSFDPSFQSPHELEQRTIMHPTFLDASWHIMFPVIQALLGREITNGYVSTFMGSIHISGILAQIAGSPEVQHYTLSAFTELPTPRVAVNNILIHQPDGELMVEARDIEATAMQTESPRSKDRTLFFRQRWQPCFDFEGGDGHATDDGHSIILHEKGLQKVLESYSFQYPTSKILYVTSNPDEVRDIVPSLWFAGTQRPRFAALHVWTDTPEEKLEPLQEEHADDGVAFCDPETGYDLVINTPSSRPIAPDNLHTLLSPGGFVITTKSSNGHGKACATTSADSCIVSRRQRPQREPSDLDILLSSSGIRSPRTDNIVKHLSNAPLAGEVKSMDVESFAGADRSASTFIILASLDEDIKSSDAAWAGVRDILSRENITVVWVLQGATMECKNPDHAALLGIMRTIRNENPESRFITLDVEEATSEELISNRILQILDPDADEEEYADRAGCLYIPRVEEDVILNRKLPNGIGNGPTMQRFGDHPALTLRIGQVGLMETLHFVENDEITDCMLGDDEIETKVKASAVNFHDIAVAMGIIQDPKMSGEFAGVVTKVGSKVSEFKEGDHVAGFSPAMGAHGTLVRTPALFCHKVPEALPFPIAAALPVIICTAHYCLVDIAHLQPGETVLIHAAAGGVGQMAIQIAQRIGARVLATCSKPKREFLKTHYGLPDSQILSSRDDSFVGGVMDATDGLGVDVVLNSLAGELLLASWNCLKTFGRFVEIGKRDIHQNSNLGMDVFRKNATFASFDMVTVFEERPEIGRKMLEDGLALYFNGDLKAPETLFQFSYSEIEKAFRMLQLGRKPGKIVLVPDENDVVAVKPSTYKNGPLFNPQKIYMLTGGLGGLGAALSEWMFLRGARRFAFLSRSGIRKHDARKTAEWLRSKHCEVIIYEGDVGVLHDVKAMKNIASPDLAGIIHLAADFEDAMIRTLTLKQLNQALHAKCQGAMNLHLATSSLKLDFFVSVSSGASVWGNRGQAPYVAANAWLDAFSRWRCEQGLAASTMNAGAVTTRGLIADNEIARQSLERNKLDKVTEQELMYLTEEAVNVQFPNGDTDGLDWHQVIMGINVVDPDVYWAGRSLFRDLYANRKYGGAATSKGAKNLASLLQNTPNVEERVAAALDAFLSKVAAVLGTPLESIAPSNPLSFYGLDSIVAVEFRRWFKEVTGVDVSLFDILAAHSIEGLVAKIVPMMPTVLQGQASAGNSDANNESSKATSKKADTTSHVPERSTKDPAPLSAFQSSLASQLSDTINLWATVRLEGKLSFEELESSLHMVIDRQSILKTAFHRSEGAILQEAIRLGRFSLKYHDMSDSSSSKLSISELVSAHVSQELNIADGEVGHGVLIKQDWENHLLVLTVHPLCFDRLSLSILMNDWVKLYDLAVSGGDTTSVPYPRVSYADFAVWQKTQLKSDSIESHLQYWTSHLAGLPTSSKLLPFTRGDRSLPHSNANREQHTLQLTGSTLRRVERISSMLNATTFHFLLAAFRTYLYRHVGENDLVMLLIDDERPHPDVEGLIGNFVNWIPLRLPIGAEDKTFEEVVLQARDETTTAQSHSDAPYSEIINALGMCKTASPALALSKIAIQHQVRGSAAAYKTVDFEATVERQVEDSSLFELALDIVDEDEKLDLSLGYCTDLYQRDQMEGFFSAFNVFLLDLIVDHRQPIMETKLPN